MQEAELKEAEGQLRKENALFFLEMHEGQEKFIRCKNRNNLTPKRRLAESGNKWGKTEIGLAEDIAHSIGYRPWLNENDPDYKIDVKVPNQGLVGCETMSHSVPEKIEPTLKRLIPKLCKYRPKKNPQGYWSAITIERGPKGEDCGSKIHIRSYDQEATTYEGIDYDWEHWDEPPPKNILQAAERGKVTTNAPSWFTMTPLKEAYIYDEYSLKAKNNGGDDDEIYVLRGEMWENCRDWCYKCRLDIPKNTDARIINRCPHCNRILGFISKSGMEEYLKTLDPEEREAREKGLWKHLSGLVYKSLDRDVHVYPDFRIPKNWMRIEGIDPHDAKPTCYLFGAVSPEEINIFDHVRNRIYFYDYLLLKDDLDTIVRNIRVKRETNGYSKAKWIVMDGKYGAREEMESKTWEDELRRRGLGYIILSKSRQGDVELGHKIVREYLNPHYSILTGESRPGMLFARDGCGGEGGPIHHMFNYQYKEGQDRPDDKQFKDFPDIIRYIALEEPVYQSPENEILLVEQLKKRKEEIYRTRRM